MEFSGLGGGIMVVLAAGLWLVYLMPTMFRRREFVASERNEVRRQQALQVLRETEAHRQPVSKRVEAIVSSNGEVTDHARLAEAIARSRQAQAARVTNKEFTDEASQTVPSASSRQRMARRLRRTRALVSLVLLVAIVTIVVQAVLMVSTGVAAAAWGVLGFAAVIAVVAVAALGRLATMARRRAAAPASVRVGQPLQDHQIESAPVAVAEEESITSWTPVPLPKPQYLTRSEVAADVASDPVEELRVAAAESDRALREAQDSPEVTPITTPSKYAAMGHIDFTDVEGTNLDEVLRRRRQAV